MKRYRVDYIVADRVVASVYRDGWTRHDARVAADGSPEAIAAKAEARKMGAEVMWDATDVSKCPNPFCHDGKMLTADCKLWHDCPACLGKGSM